MRFAVIGNGYLATAVKRRWLDYGELVHSWQAEYVIVLAVPDDLALIRELRHHKVITASTDAIRESTEYAAAKAQLEGEAGPWITILRTGLVDIRKTYSLGYTDWTCNPLTPIEWADRAYQLRDTAGIHPDGRETVTRYDVVRAQAEILGRPLPVPAEYGSRLDRVQPSSGQWPELAQGIREYVAWAK